MRIGLVVGNYPEISETFISRHVEFLLSAGHHVTIFRIYPKAGLARRRGNLPKIVDLKSNKRSVTRNGLAALVELAQKPGSLPAGLKVCLRASRLRRPGSTRSERLVRFLAISSQDLDLLHVHFGSSMLPLLGVREVVGLPVIISLLGSDVTSAEYLPVSQYLDLLPKESDSLTAVCQYLVGEFHRRTNSDTPIEVLPSGIPCSLFATDRRYERIPSRLLTVARLHWKKGLLYALHAARELKARNVDFTYDIVGEGQERQNLEAAIRDFGLTERVRLLGPMDPSMVPTHFKQADIFLLSSVSEGMGNVLAEAQAAGLPIVATRVGGIPETVRDGTTGLLVPPRDPLALADAVTKLIQDPALYRQFSMEGPRQVVPFDIHRVGERWLAIYRNLIDRTHRWAPISNNPAPMEAQG